MVIVVIVLIVVIVVLLRFVWLIVVVLSNFDEGTRPLIVCELRCMGWIQFVNYWVPVWEDFDL